MTRFARAKGSKASNERAPEDSTPWEVMKEQLLQTKKENEDSQKRQKAEQQRIENYQSFLKEQKVQKKKATWCDFPETGNMRNNDELPKKKKKKNVTQNLVHNTNVVDNDTPDTKEKKEKNKKKNKKADQSNLNQDPETETGAVKREEYTNQSTELITKKKKQKGSKLKANEDEHNNVETKLESKPNNLQKNNKAHKVKKLKKFVDGKPVRRKEVNDRSFQLIINGKDVELVRFDGFPIMKKDAERLQDLKNSMIKKGIPKSEVQRTMKLERRRAEKALARLKRDVCYNCRKGGHNLSDCPDLKSRIPGVDAADGICFKCGSTEHKQFECKVQKDKDFKFATCFICKEQGHIARQCPDNPKGLYPNGGSCKLCGDVTHLRKDCPTAQNKKVESSIKLQTLDNDNNIEGIDHHNTTTNTETSKKPKKIKF